MILPRKQSEATAAAGRHFLSFDVEEYFQVEAGARGGVRPEAWGSFEKRLAPRVERILGLLADHGSSATFFILGWVARHERELVRMIASAGHEIASHGMTHTMLGRLGQAQFRKELVESRQLLSDISAQPVVGYRAPTFSVTHETAWALDVLAEAGFRYDSSVFPVRHDRYGVPDAPRFVHSALGPEGGRIVEIPPSTLRLLGANWPVGGGGYLRLLPTRLVAAALRQAENAGRPGMIYLHPWELDPDQPVLPMSRPSRWRHRVNLGKTEAKLRRLLQAHRFRSVASCADDLPGHESGEFRYGTTG